jgi:hypothetical protein
MSITPQEVQKLALPAQCPWFWNQATMFAHGSDPSARFNIAWDKDDKGKKVYAFYDDPASFYLALAPLERRHGYELIHERARCLFYLDIEWLGPEDDDHVKMQWIADKLRAICEERFGLNPELYVSCSSRPAKEDGLYKNSYHLVARSLAFQNNHDGAMLRLAQALCAFGTPAHHEWLVGDKCVVDLAVYTKNRLVRLPFCSKFGSPVPFVRISGAPLEDDFSGYFDDVADPDAWSPFVLTAKAPDDALLVATPLPALANSEGVKRKRSAKELPPKSLPFPLGCLRDLLVLAGDDVSLPTKAVYKPSTLEWQVQCDQAKHTRPCLTTEGVTHDSNNCLLFVTRWNDAYRVTCYCTAASCAGTSKPILGYVSYHDGDWVTERSANGGSANDGSLGDPSANGGGSANDGSLGDPSANDGIRQRSRSPSVPRSSLADPLDPSANTYQLVKERHEQRCVHISLTPKFICKLPRDKDPAIYTEAEVRSTFARVYYYELVTDPKDGGSTFVKKPFIARWLRDDTIGAVDDIVVDPTGTIPNVFNLWKPFKASLMPPVDDAAIPDAIDPIVRHIHEVITGENMDHTNWILDYLANMVQRPERKSQVNAAFFSRLFSELTPSG